MTLKADLGTEIIISESGHHRVIDMHGDGCRMRVRSDWRVPLHEVLHDACARWERLGYGFLRCPICARASAIPDLTKEPFE